MTASKKQYEDIIHLPRHRSKRRPHMPLQDRAAQFLPFAALSGHEAAIEETARLTVQKIVLTDDEQARLNAQLMSIAKQLEREPEVAITYFLPDKHKSGGAYVTEIGRIKKIDDYTQRVIMHNGAIIPIADIFSCEARQIKTDEST